MIKKILFIGFCIVLLASLTGCGQDPDVVKLGNEGSFTAEQCLERGFNDKVIMFESKYCGHCRKTLPDFIVACEEHDVTPIILDLSEDYDIAQFETYDIELVGTPTFIFGCDYIVGVKDKEAYSSYLDAFLISKV